MLLWPFSDERFTSPLILYYGVRNSEGLLSFFHIITLLNEIAVLIVVGPLVWIFSMIRRLSSKSGGAKKNAITRHSCSSLKFERLSLIADAFRRHRN